MLAAEDLFAADSDMVAHLLLLLQTRVLQTDRMILAVATTDDLLDGLGLPVAERLEQYREAVARHVGGPEYRQHNAVLRSLLGSEQNPQDAGVLEPALEHMARRRHRLAPIGARLRDLAQRGELTRPLAAVYGSLMHMHCNRLGLDAETEQTVLGLLRRTRDGLAHTSSDVRDDTVATTPGAAETADA